ncbi:MAG: hypothetical protein HYY79_09465 [Betaproteobacteria bacterium]|nr:hypothetical protein [Betaproteobacteria bacterium]
MNFLSFDMKSARRGFASVEPLVALAVMAVFVVAGIDWFGSAWWLVILYVIAGFVVGSSLSVAAHYNPLVGIVILVSSMAAIFYFTSS